MTQVDAALEVRVVGRHIVHSDGVIQTRAWSTHSRGNVIVRLQLRDVQAHRFHTAKTFVTQNQEIVSCGRCAVFRRVDLLVGAIDADAQDLDQDSAAVRYVIDARFRYFTQVYGIRAAGEHGDRLHSLIQVQ